MLRGTIHWAVPPALFIVATTFVGCETGPTADYSSFEEVEAQSKKESVERQPPDVSPESGAAEADPVAKSTEVAAVTPQPAVTPSAIAETSGLKAVAAPSATEAYNGTGEIPASALAPVNVVDGGSVASVMQVRGDGAPAKPTPDVTASPETPRKIELLVPNRTFQAEGPSGALRVSYDDLDLLKVLNMEPVPETAVEHFPSWLSALNGRMIRVRGFMYPTFEATGIQQFVLARDNQICCFGRDPKVYDLIAVDLKPKSTTNYIANRPFDVVGRFRIEMLADGGKPYGLYWLEDAEVIQQ